MRAVARAVAVILCLAGVAGAEIIDRVLATVGSQVITLSDLRAAETFGLKLAGSTARTPAETLRALVDRELMLGEVQRFAAPPPDPALVDRRMTRIRAAFPTAAAYDQALARTAMTVERLRAFVAADLQIDAYVDQRFGAPTPSTGDEVQRYYAAHPAEFTVNGRLIPLDEVRLQVEERLAAERKSGLVDQWLERLRRSTHVEINAAALEALK